MIVHEGDEHLSLCAGHYRVIASASMPDLKRDSDWSRWKISMRRAERALAVHREQVRVAARAAARGESQ